MGDDAGHDGTQIGAERTAAIEAKPSDPEEDCAEDDVGDVVRAVWQPVVLVVSSAPPEHQGVCKGSGARGDVDGRAAGKVEATELEGPPVGVPGPVGNRIVDDCRPDEHEDDGGEHSAAIGCGTDCEGGAVGGQDMSASHSSILSTLSFSSPQRNTRFYIRDSSEHALEKTEQQVGNLGASHAGLAQHVHETEVAQVADKRATGMTEGQTVTPEEPLESHHCYTHQR